MLLLVENIRLIYGECCSTNTARVLSLSNDVPVENRERLIGNLFKRR
jgi:hypothetical protein